MENDKKDTKPNVLFMNTHEFYPIKDPSRHAEIHHVNNSGNIIFKEIFYGK